MVDSATSQIEEGRDVSAPFALTFQCQQSRTGELTRSTAADGVLGMSTGPFSFIRQMHVAGLIPTPVFGLCFINQQFRSDSEPGRTAGAVTLGGVERRRHVTPLVYAQNAASVVAKGWNSYLVRVRRIYLRQGGMGGSSAVQITDSVRIQALDKVDYGMLNGEGLEIDTGSPYTTISGAVEFEFRSVWQTMTGIEWEYNPLPLSKKEAMALPTILLQLEVR